jgi:hypothetical protein
MHRRGTNTGRNSVGTRLLALALLSGGVLAWLCVPATAADYIPIYHPEVAISRAAGAIEIDGDLGDAGWQGAAVADHFAEHNPGDQTQPEVETRVLIAYDDENLYVGWLCYDNPTDVRATRCRRDNIFSDDNVVLCLDTYGESSVAYEIMANPYGIQGDLLFSTGLGEDETYDLIYKSAGRVTPDGYVIEMAVPFASLRFPADDQQTWRVDFWRNRPRGSRYQYSWAAYNRDESCWPCQWGTLRGISGVKPGAGLEIMPAVIAHQSSRLGVAGAFEDGHIDGDVGAGISYDVSSELTAEATINPDFSQVESDAEQIDVNTTFALFFDEHRPFFQEGSDLFTSFFNAVYTRSINDPLAAAKLTWREGANSVALLSARDDHSPVTMPFEERSEFIENGKSYSNIVRAKRDFGGQSYVGLVATDRRFDSSGSGSLVGLDGKWRFSASNTLTFQALATHTEEIDNPALGDTSWQHTYFDDGQHTVALDGESFWGEAWFVSVDRDCRDYSVGFDYTERGPTFRADNGMETSNNSRLLTTWVGGVYRFEESKILEYVEASTSANQKWNFDGVTKSRQVTTDLEYSLRRGQTQGHAELVLKDELFGGKQFDGTWTAHNCISTQPSGALSFGGNINYGHQIARKYLVIGKQWSYGAQADLKPIDCLLLSFSYSGIKSDCEDTGERLFSQEVLGAYLSLQVRSELSIRLVLQYNDCYDLRRGREKTWGADPLVTYQISPFTIFYVGSTQDYRDLVAGGEGDPTGWTLTGRQYFMKMQYLFRI